MFFACMHVVSLNFFGESQIWAVMRGKKESRFQFHFSICWSFLVCNAIWTWYVFWLLVLLLLTMMMLLLGNYEACEALLSSQVDINAQDNEKRTGLCCIHQHRLLFACAMPSTCIDSNLWAIYSYLNTTLWTSFLWIALHAAAFSDNVSCLRLLLKSGADANLADTALHTPLFLACEQGNVPAISELVTHSDLTLLDTEVCVLGCWASGSICSDDTDLELQSLDVYIFHAAIIPLVVNMYTRLLASHPTALGGYFRFNKLISR